MKDQHLSELNQHPLNQAALRRMRMEGLGADPGQMHLLDLAHAGLPEEDEGDWAGSDRRVLANWGQSRQHQESALAWLASEELDPELVEKANLERVSEEIVGTLRSRSGSPGLKELK